MSDDEFQETCRKAFNEMFAAARRIHSHGTNRDTMAQYGSEVGRIGARHGLTLEESLHYGVRIWIATSGEAHT